MMWIKELSREPHWFEQHFDVVAALMIEVLGDC